METLIDLFNNFTNNVITFLSNMGFIGGFLLVLLESAFPVLPLALFIGMNCLAYGLVLGFLISYAGTITGCLISFFLFKYGVTSFVNKILKPKTREKATSLMKKFSNIDFSTLVLINSLPFTPAFLINIVAGLCKMDNKKFFLSLLISKICIVVFWGYIGTNFFISLKDPISLIKLLILVIITYIISKIVRKIVKI